MNIFALINLYHSSNVDKGINQVPRRRGEHETKAVKTVDGFLSLWMEPEKHLEKTLDALI